MATTSARPRSTHTAPRARGRAGQPLSRSFSKAFYFSPLVPCRRLHCPLTLPTRSAARRDNGDIGGDTQQGHHRLSVYRTARYCKKAVRRTPQRATTLGVSKCAQYCPSLRGKEREPVFVQSVVKRLWNPSRAAPLHISVSRAGTTFLLKSDAWAHYEHVQEMRVSADNWRLQMERQRG